MTTQQADLQFTHLFSPGRIGPLETKNRIVMAPIANGATEEGYVTDRQIEFFVARARGGVGLIICQSGGAMEEYRGAGRMWIWDDKFLPGLTRLASAVKAAGASLDPLGHGVSSIRTATSSASTMLSWLATPFHARSNAVPWSTETRRKGRPTVTFTPERPTQRLVVSS